LPNYVRLFLYWITKLSQLKLRDDFFASRSLLHRRTLTTILEKINEQHIDSEIVKIFEEGCDNTKLYEKIKGILKAKHGNCDENNEDTNSKEDNTEKKNEENFKNLLRDKFAISNPEAYCQYIQTKVNKVLSGKLLDISSLFEKNYGKGNLPNYIRLFLYWVTKLHTQTLPMKFFTGFDLLSQPTLTDIKTRIQRLSIDSKIKKIFKEDGKNIEMCKNITKIHGRNIFNDCNNYNAAKKALDELKTTLKEYKIPNLDKCFDKCKESFLNLSESDKDNAEYLEEVFRNGKVHNLGWITPLMFLWLQDKAKNQSGKSRISKIVDSISWCLLRDRYNAYTDIKDAINDTISKGTEIKKNSALWNIIDNIFTKAFGDIIGRPNVDNKNSQDQNTEKENVKKRKLNTFTPNNKISLKNLLHNEEKSINDNPNFPWDFFTNVSNARNQQLHTNNDLDPEKNKKAPQNNNC
jgi:hypothetical protein